MLIDCHVCKQPFFYKIVNMYYNSICPSCLEKHPNTMKQIDEAYEERDRTVDEAREKFNEADEQADKVLDAKLIIILDAARRA